MQENGVKINTDNASAGATFNSTYSHIDAFMVCTGLRYAVNGSELPSLMTLFAVKMLMDCRTIAITDKGLRYGTRGPAHGNGSHRRTLKKLSKTASITWSY